MALVAAVGVVPVQHGLPEAANEMARAVVVVARALL
jgi:hypothetical protein